MDETQSEHRAAEPMHRSEEHREEQVPPALVARLLANPRRVRRN